jgi:hypothetical protein
MTSVARNEKDHGNTRMWKGSIECRKEGKRTLENRGHERYGITSVLTSRQSHYQPTHVV